MKNEILNLCDQLVAAAANGVYQGIIIALLVALWLHFLVRTNAATRHAVWFCTLLLLVALVLAHCVVDSFALRRVTSTAPALAPNAGLATPPEAAPALSETAAQSEASPGSSPNLPDTLPIAEPQPSQASSIPAQPDVAAAITTPEPTAIEPANAPGSTALSPEPTALRQLLARLLNPISVELALGSNFPRIATILLAVWLLMAGLGVATLIVQLVRIQKLKHQSLPPDAALHALFQRLSARLVTNRQVELRVSPTHRSAVLLGFLHPVVLLPAAPPLDLAEAELVIRHELAHVQRRDDWVNLLQHTLLALFFFHPALWRISRQLSLEREIACDDHVLHQSQRPQAYALVLTNLAARMQRPLALLAPGSLNSKTQLKERIDMILNTHRNASPRLAKTWLALITSAAAVVAVAVICSAPRFVLAQVAAPAPVAPVASVAPVAPVASIASVAPVASVAALPHPAPVVSVLPNPPLPATVSAGLTITACEPVVSTTPVVVATSVEPFSQSTLPVVVAGSAATSGTSRARRPVVTGYGVGYGQPSPYAAAIESPRATGAARPATTPRPDDRDSSLEERLDRLERKVDSLMNKQNSMGFPYIQPNQNQNQNPFSRSTGRTFIQPKPKPDSMLDRKQLAESDLFAKQHAGVARIHPQEIEKFQEQNKREAEKTVEELKRTTADIEKARKADQKQLAKKLKADSQRQLNELRRQSEALERQKEKLDREIERLEQHQDELDSQDEDSNDTESTDGEPKESV